MTFVSSDKAIHCEQMVNAAMPEKGAIPAIFTGSYSLPESRHNVGFVKYVLRHIVLCRILVHQIFTFCICSSRHVAVLAVHQSLVSFRYHGIHLMNHRSPKNLICTYLFMTLLRTSQHERLLESPCPGPSFFMMKGFHV